MANTQSTAKREEFYVITWSLNQEYHETQWFTTKDNAAWRASQASLYGRMIAGVFSTAQDKPLETWVKGSRSGRGLISVTLLTRVMGRFRWYRITASA